MTSSAGKVARFIILMLLLEVISAWLVDLEVVVTYENSITMVAMIDNWEPFKSSCMKPCVFDNP